MAAWTRAGANGGGRRGWKRIAIGVAGFAVILGLMISGWGEPAPRPLEGDPSRA